MKSSGPQTLKILSRLNSWPSKGTFLIEIVGYHGIIVKHKKLWRYLRRLKFSSNFEMRNKYFPKIKLEMLLKLKNWKTLTKKIHIDGCHAVDHINYSLVTPVSRQTQSDCY